MKFKADRLIDNLLFLAISALTPLILLITKIYNVMKKTLTLFFILTLLFLTSKAQDCSIYFPFKKGIKAEMSNYDKKDKLITTAKYEVTNNESIAGGTLITFSNETYDAKGKLLAKSDLSAKCINGDYYTDIKAISSDMIPRSSDISVSVTGDQMVYPASMKVGDVLKDASINVKSSMGSMTIMNMTATIVNRKVEGNETIETPAGKFDCLKITYTLNMKLMGSRTMQGVEYLAKGVGVVKQETYDEKGAKQSTLLLTKLE